MLASRHTQCVRFTKNFISPRTSLSRRKRNGEMFATTGGTMTLNLVYFQSTFQERVPFTCVHIISGSQLCKAIICPLQGYHLHTLRSSARVCVCAYYTDRFHLVRITCIYYKYKLFNDARQPRRTMRMAFSLRGYVRP